MFSKANNFELDLKDLDESQLAAVTSAEENVVIRASAGSGKTKSLISAIANYRYEHINDRICAITYTRAARSEMEERLKNMGIFDVEVTTIHVWARNQLEFFADHYDFLINILQESQIKKILKNEIVPQYLLKSKVKSVNIDILYTYITGSKNMDISDNYRRTLNAIETRYIDYKRNQHLYDFTDYPLYLYDVLTVYNENINTIDALFVDEFQDVDETQFKIFEKVNTNKKFFIGDPWQCQPAGTKVMIRSKEGAKEKNIEDIEVGDPIVFYDQSQGYVSGSKLPHNAIIKKVLRKQENNYCDSYLINIKTENGLKSSYTSNHRTFVRFNKTDENLFVVYLMSNNQGRFRVGTIPLFYTGKTDKTQNPWRDKMRAEGCTKIWLLKVFKTNHEALVEEAHISYYYRIPQTCWQTIKVSWTLEDIDYIYKGINTFYGAMECLQDYKLDIMYPLLDDNIDWSKRSHFTTNASSEIYAINIMPEYMSCIAYGSETSHKNMHAEKIIKVEKQLITEPIKVYSLEVEGGTYVADKIITHNSIFVFRGADGEVFSKLDKFKQYKLKYNYRSYQEIIDYATTVYDTLKKDIEVEEENPNGFYISEINWSDPSSVICDRKYGGSVTVVNPYSVSWIFTDTNKTYVASALEFNNIMTSNPMILCRTNKQVREIQSCGYINASTVHQAKGLEYDNVIVIDCDIKSMEDLNIAYVAMTRAKNNLFIINWSQFELLFKNWLEG